MHTNCSKMMSIDDVNGYVLGVTPAPPEIAGLILKAYESHWFPLIWGGRLTSYNVGLMFWAHLLVVGLEKEHQRLAYEFITAHKSSWEKKSKHRTLTAGFNERSARNLWLLGLWSEFHLYHLVASVWARAAPCAVSNDLGNGTEKKVGSELPRSMVFLDGTNAFSCNKRLTSIPCLQPRESLRFEKAQTVGS